MVAPFLAYYNPNKPTILQTNASCKGLGACLLQNEKPVYFASKALTEMQKGYVAIELELLAVAWAMEKFHHFLYGNEFTLKTDQKPLESDTVKKLKPNHTKTSKDPHKNITISLQNKVHPGGNQSCCRLPIQTRSPKRLYIITQAACQPNH